VLAKLLSHLEYSNHHLPLSLLPLGHPKLSGSKHFLGFRVSERVTIHVTKVSHRSRKLLQRKPLS